MSTADPPSDRDLLFGLLALQMDLVSQEQLAGAMEDVTLQRGGRLPETLVRRGALDEADRAAVEQVVSRRIERHGGATPSLAKARATGAHASLTAATLTRHGDDDEAALPATRQRLSADGAPLPTAQQAARAPGPARYAPLRPHARGGLGEVLVARDEEIGREVALKEIRRDHADDADSRARFVFEGELTGHLEHPGVVPVYGAGTYPDGRPYYAMRFIKGEPMDAAIRNFHKDVGGRDPGKRSLALRELLTRFVAVCEAVAYAHSRGVIHRDLKPANVMLGQYGETLVVDWGLAKVLGRDEGPALLPVVAAGGDGGASATQLGEAVGTPAFMPPEQARGVLDRMGPRSDVFSLGAILYQILTGVPPYQGADAQEVLAKASAGEVVPAGKLEPGVPRALEAVCARAMAASPQGRYGDAEALAADVKRFLADEPTTAYREPLADRARRWGRRHRSAVGVGVVLLVASVLGLGVGLWAVEREAARVRAAEKEARENLAEAKANLDRAEKAEEEAKANLKLAREAIDESFNVAKDDPLFKAPGMEKPRKLLLAKTLPFYKKFRAASPGDPWLRRDEGRQWLRVGFIEGTLGNAGKALEAFETARATFAALAEERPGEQAFRVDLADVQTRIGHLLVEQDRRDEALPRFREVLAIQAALYEASPDELQYRRDLASAHQNLANLYTRLGRREEALAEHAKVRVVRDALAKEHPDRWLYVNDLAVARSSLGALLLDVGRREEALAEFLAARELYRSLAKNHPAVTDYRLDMAGLLNNLASALGAAGKHGEAVKEQLEAVEMRSALARANPGLPHHRAELARARSNLGALLGTLDRREEAMKEHAAARDLYADLVEAHPDVPKYRLDLARAHHNYGAFLGAQEALNEYGKVRAVLAPLVKQHPEAREYRRDLAAMLYNAGNLYLAHGKLTEALKVYGEARDVLSPLAKQHPDLPEYRGELAGVHNNLGAARLKQGKPQEALKEWGEAVALFSAPDLRGHLADLAGARFNRGVVFMGLGKHDDALKEFTEAQVHLSALAKANPAAPEHRLQLARTHNNLGFSRIRLGKQQEAMKDWDEAERFSSALVKANPAAPDYRRELASAHFNRGATFANQRKLDEALKELAEARDHFAALTRAQPGNADHQEWLARTCVERGRRLVNQRPEEAAADCTTALAAIERLRKAEPDNAAAGGMLRDALNFRALSLTVLKRPAEADAVWERLLPMVPEGERPSVLLNRALARARAGDYLRSAEYFAERSGSKEQHVQVLLRLAVIQAANAHHAAGDSSRPLAEREKRAEGYARDVMALLRRLEAGGAFRDADAVGMLEDGAFEYVRKRADYQGFLAGLKRK